MGLWFCLLCTQKTQARLLWKYKVGARVVHFNNIPFTVVKSELLTASKVQSTTRARSTVAVEFTCRVHEK